MTWRRWMILCFLGWTWVLGATEAPFVVLLHPNSSLAHAGLMRFDRLLSVDGQPLTLWKGHETLASLPAGKHVLRVARAGQERELIWEKEAPSDPPQATERALGFRMATLPEEPERLLQAFQQGLEELAKAPQPEALYGPLQRLETPFRRLLENLRWVPEVRRLEGALQLRYGDPDEAARALEEVRRAYESLGLPLPDAPQLEADLAEARNRQALLDQLMDTSDSLRWHVEQVEPPAWLFLGFHPAGEVATSFERGPLGRRMAHLPRTHSRFPPTRYFDEPLLAEHLLRRDPMATGPWIAHGLVEDPTLVQRLAPREALLESQKKGMELVHVGPVFYGAYLDGLLDPASLPLHVKLGIENLSREAPELWLGRGNRELLEELVKTGRPCVLTILRGELVRTEKGLRLTQEVFRITPQEALAGQRPQSFARVVLSHERP